MAHPTEKQKPLRVAVIGAGDWAQRYHFPALALLARERAVNIAGVWNRTAATAERVARQFSIGRVYRSLDEVLADEHVDCFVVLVNSNVLAKTVCSLLVRGLPIFTEKPPGATYREALMLAERVTVPNLVAFNRRYMPINRRFKELADAIEGVYFAECHFYRNERLYDHFVRETGVHGINYMEYLCGAIREVHTEVGRIARNGSQFWISSVTFESGTRGVFKFFPCCGSSVERYEVHGQDASIYLHCPQTYTSDHPGRIEVHKNGRLDSVVYDAEEGGDLVSMGIVDQYREFFATVVQGLGTASNFANACNTMRVAEAIEAGTHAGKEPEPVPVDPNQGSAWRESAAFGDRATPRTGAPR
jgi:predicted dehydrogenase